MCVVGMLALPGGCLLPDMKGQRRGGHPQPPGRAPPSCVYKVGPDPGPHTQPTLLQDPAHLSRSTGYVLLSQFC